MVQEWTIPLVREDPQLPYWTGGAFRFPPPLTTSKVREEGVNRLFCFFCFFPAPRPPPQCVFKGDVDRNSGRNVGEQDVFVPSNSCLAPRKYMDRCAKATVWAARLSHSCLNRVLSNLDRMQASARKLLLQLQHRQHRGVCMPFRRVLALSHKCPGLLHSVIANTLAICSQRYTIWGTWWTSVSRAQDHHATEWVGSNSRGGTLAGKGGSSPRLGEGLTPPPRVCGRAGETEAGGAELASTRTLVVRQEPSKQVGSLPLSQSLSTPR